MKKIIIAPDSYKESLSAKEICDVIGQAFNEIFPDLEVVKIPLADGGEGTTEVLTQSLNGRFIEVETFNANNQPMRASYGLVNNDKLAIIELASSSGLADISAEDRNPLYATTYGTGLLIKDALNKGVEEIIIGLGGSATNDGGAGIAQALGVSLLDSNNNEIPHGGKYLKDIMRIDTSNVHPQLKNVKLKIACDVDNPLCGPNGATHIFAPQKGASVEMVEELDKALENYADKIQDMLNKSVKDMAGAGAAGGTTATLVSFFKNSTIQSGVEIIGNVVKLEEKSQGADLIITGEGKIDYQTLSGKTPIAPLNVANKYNIPIIAIAGALGQDYEQLLEAGFKGLYSVTVAPTTLQDALKTTRYNLYNLSLSIAKTLQAFSKN